MAGEGAAENAPVGFGGVRAGGALVVCGAFGSMRVLASGWMVMSEFHCEDFGAVFQSVERLSRDISVDGLEGALGPVVLFHWLLAEACVLDCLLLVKVVGQSIRLPVFPLIVRLALEPGMKGTIWEGAELLSRQSVARACHQRGHSSELPTEEGALWWHHLDGF